MFVQAVFMNKSVNNIGLFTVTTLWLHSALNNTSMSAG